MSNSSRCTPLRGSNDTDTRCHAILHMNGKQSPRSSVHLIFSILCTHIACPIAIQTGGKRGWRARHQRTLLSNATRHARLCTSSSQSGRQTHDVSSVRVRACQSTQATACTLVRATEFSAGYEIWKVGNSFCAYQMLCVFDAERRGR